MQLAPLAAPKPLVTIVENHGAAAAVTPGFASQTKTVNASGPLAQAVAYASGLVMRGWAGSVGVLQAQDGWKLVALESGSDAASIKGATQVRRHTYQLAAVVDASTMAVWSGKQRISELHAVQSPVVIPTR